MSVRIFAVFAIGGWLASAPLAASEAPRPLRLAEMVADARLRNPEIRAARARAEAAARVPARVSAYDDPMFMYEAYNVPERLSVDRADQNILKLTQKVPFPGKRTAAGKIAERDAEVARREAEIVELEVVTAVKQTYADFWRAHQNLWIDSRDQELARRFAKIAEQKYAVGQVSQPDVLRAQVELTRLINRVTTDTLTIEGARAELAALLSRAPEEVLGAPEDPPPPRLDSSPDSLIDLALRHRPELAAERAAVERGEEGLRLARLQYYPDFEFGLERFINFGRNDALGATASISLPFAYRSKYDAGTAEAEARLASARSDLRRTEDRARREVKQAYLRSQAALLERDLFVTTHIPQADQALQASEIGYQTGKVDFLSLIDSLRAIESVHIEHIRSEADFERSYADLERAVGRELPRTGRTEEASHEP